MLILIEKDESTKVVKEVADIDGARAYQALGFNVKLANEDGTYSPLDAEPEPEKPAVVAKKTTKKK